MEISWVTNPYLYYPNIDALLDPIREYIFNIHINNIYGDVFKYYLTVSGVTNDDVLSSFIDSLGNIKFIPLVYFIKITEDLDKSLVHNITYVLKEVVSTVYNVQVDYITESYAQGSDFEYAYFIPMYSFNMIYVSKEIYLKLNDMIDPRDYYSKWILPKDALSLFALSEYNNDNDLQVSTLKLDRERLYLTNMKIDRLESYIKKLRSSGYFSLSMSSYKYRDIYIEVASLWGEIQAITDDSIIIKDDIDHGISKEIWYKQASEDILNGSIPKVAIHLGTIGTDDEDKLVMLSYTCKSLYEDLCMKYEMLTPYINEVSVLDRNGNFSIRIYDKYLYEEYLEMLSSIDIDQISSSYVVIKRKSEMPVLDADTFNYEGSVYYVINRSNLSTTSSTSTIQTSSTTYMELSPTESHARNFKNPSSVKLPDEYIVIKEYMNMYMVNIEIPTESLFSRNASDYLVISKRLYINNILLNNITIDDYPTETKSLYLTDNKEEAMQTYNSYRNMELSNWGSYVFTKYKKISRTIFIT